jgi:hypothetical protein
MMYKKHVKHEKTITVRLESGGPDFKLAVGDLNRFLRAEAIVPEKLMNVWVRKVLCLLLFMVCC